MGATASHPHVNLPEEDIKRLKFESGFTKTQLTDLHERFCQLDADEDGFITWSDLMDISKLSQNPIGDKIADQFMRRAYDYQPMSVSNSNDAVILNRSVENSDEKRTDNENSKEKQMEINNTFALQQEIGENNPKVVFEISEENEDYQELVRTTTLAEHRVQWKINFAQYCHVLMLFKTDGHRRDATLPKKGSGASLAEEAELSKRAQASSSDSVRHDSVHKLFPGPDTPFATMRHIEQLQFLFGMYDPENIGYISEDNLLNLIVSMIKGSNKSVMINPNDKTTRMTQRGVEVTVDTFYIPHLGEISVDKLQMYVRKALQEMNPDGDKVTFDHFLKSLQTVEHLEMKMEVEY